MAKNRNGKPTAFQVDWLKKNGVSLKGVKTYRDAENAMKRARNAAKKAEKPVVVPAKPAPVKKAAKKQPQQAVAKKPQKQVAGVGVFRIKIAKSDVIEALLIGLAKSILAVLDAK